MDPRPLTIFCDIDGTLIHHQLPSVAQNPEHKAVLLSGTLEKLQEWDRLGYKIILTTGRKESLRRVTEKQLEDVGIIYDQLIMGIGGGARVLINDKKPDGSLTAFSFCPDRNEGISKIDLPLCQNFQNIGLCPIL